MQVNIGGDWEGGGLKFFEDDSEEPSFVLPQAKGQAFLHRGKIRHQAGELVRVAAEQPLVHRWHSCRLGC